MTTPRTDEELKEVTVLGGIEVDWQLKCQLLAAAVERADNENAALIAKRDALAALLERRTEALRMFVDAAKPRRQDGYHEMPMFSARELEIARASLNDKESQ